MVNVYCDYTSICKYICLYVYSSCHFSVGVFARKMHSTTKFATTVLNKCVRELCVRQLCVSKLCVGELCVRQLCVSKLCVGELCVREWESCVRESCVWESCVWGRCVCVWTIWKDVNFLLSRAAVNLIPSTAQRRRWFEIVISGLIIPSYLQFSNFQFVVNGHRPNFRTGMSLFQMFSNQKTVRFSQFDWAASEQVNPSSKDVESFPSHSFSLLIIQPFLSGLLRCFLHVRCIPHH